MITFPYRNNIGFAGNRSLVIYHIAAVGIVYNSRTHTQIHNTEHDDDIICLACHPKGHMVASGEVGKKPKIVRICVMHACVVLCILILLLL